MAFDFGQLEYEYYLVNQSKFVFTADAIVNSVVKLAFLKKSNIIFGNFRHFVIISGDFKIKLSTMLYFGWRAAFLLADSSAAIAEIPKKHEN